MENRQERPNAMHRIKTDNPFLVPDNYFDELPGRIQHRISVAGEAGASTAVKRLIPYPLIAYIAGALILLVAGYSAGRMFSGKSDTPAYSLSELVEYTEYISSEFEEDLILDILNLKQTQKPADELDEYIIQYLVNENIDINTIIEEL